MFHVHVSDEDKENEIKEKYKKDLEYFFYSVSLYHEEIVISDFNVKVSRKIIFRQIIQKKKINSIRSIKRKNIHRVVLK